MEDSKILTKHDNIVGQPYGKYDGNYLATLLEQTYGIKEYYSAEEIAFIMDFMYPVNYALKHHTLGANKYTYYTPPAYQDTRALNHRPWQKDMLNDRYKTFVCRKSRQLGITELGVERAINFLDAYSFDHVSELYTFPTYSQLRRFTKTRLEPELNESYLSTIVDKNMQSLEIKKIRNSVISFTSSNGKNGSESIHADYCLSDEFDHISAVSDESIMNTLASSKYGKYDRWSTPTSPGMGIDRLFNLGDEMFWMHKCAKCGKYNRLVYKPYDYTSKGQDNGNIEIVNPDGIDYLSKTVAEGSARYVCKYCGAPLDRWYNGKWIAKYPSRTMNDSNGIRSYQISKLNAVWVSCSQLMQQELRAESKQAFYNYDLGEPFVDNRLHVSPEDINNHLTREHPAHDRENYSVISVGIDWGVQHSVLIMGLRTNGQIDVINNFQVKAPNGTDPTQIGNDLRKIKEYIDPYSPDIIIGDVGDSGEKLAQLMEMYGRDRVWGSKNNSSPTTGLATSTGRIKATWGENDHVVTVDKLLETKRQIALMKEGKIGYYREDTPDKKMLINHWGNVIIRNEETNSGLSREVVTRVSADNIHGDHFASAQIMAYLGIEHIQNTLYENGGGFDYDFLDSKPTPTDINTRIKNNDLFS